MGLLGLAAASLSLGCYEFSWLLFGGTISFSFSFSVQIKDNRHLDASPSVTSRATPSFARPSFARPSWRLFVDGLVALVSGLLLGELASYFRRLAFPYTRYT